MAPQPTIPIDAAVRLISDELLRARMDAPFRWSPHAGKRGASGDHSEVKLAAGIPLDYMSRLISRLITDPAVLGHVEYHAVGTAEFDVGVAVATGRGLDTRLRLGREPGTACLLRLFHELGNIVHGKPDVVDATEVGALGPNIGVGGRLDLSYGQIHFPVAEIYVGATASANLFHIEYFFPEVRYFVNIGRGQGYVLDLRHGCS